MRGAGFLPGADLSMPTSTRASSASEQSHASRKLLKGLAPPPLFEPERTAEASASEHSPATAVLSRTGFVRGRRPDGPAALRIFRVVSLSFFLCPSPSPTERDLQCGFIPRAPSIASCAM